MGKKRYHYDSKGRSRGYSSDESPQSRNAKALLFALPLIAIMGMCSRGSNDVEQAQDVEVSQENLVAERGNEAEAASLAAPDDSPEIPGAEDGMITEAQTVATPPRITTTEEYLQKNYVNGDTNCSIDAYEYHVAECENGDAVFCSLAQKCAPNSDTGKAIVAAE